MFPHCTHIKKNEGHTGDKQNRRKGFRWPEHFLKIVENDVSVTEKKKRDGAINSQEKVWGFAMHTQAHGSRDAGYTGRCVLESGI